jgi:hypothetical protein
MNFSLPRFLRRALPSDLHRYFATRGILFSKPLDWTAKAFLESMKVAIESLSDREREQVFEDFERVDQLSDEIGQRVLQSFIEHDEAFLQKFHSCNGSEARGLLVLLTNAEAFDHALATAYAERMRHGRSWSGYCLPAPLVPSKSPSDLALLEAGLSALFRRFDGTGRKLKVDCFERRTCDLKGASLGQVIHYSVYVEGLPECSMEFDRDEPRRRTRRPVIEAAICCDPARGLLEVVSKGGSPLRKEIAQSFAARLLKSESALMPVQSIGFDLDRLKHPMPFPTDPSDGIKSVEVRLLRLRDAAGRFCRVILEADGEHADIHGDSAGCFGDFDPLQRPQWRVMQAKLRIAFHPEAHGKRAKAITVELRAPNGSNLRDQTRRHQIISEKYLARWGLIKKPKAAADDPNRPR